MRARNAARRRVAVKVSRASDTVRAHCLSDVRVLATTTCHTSCRRVDVQVSEACDTDKALGEVSR